MPHKCDDCFFRTDLEDENGPFPICERMRIMGFAEARAECAKPGPCLNCILTRKAIEIIDKVNDIPLNQFA